MRGNKQQVTAFHNGKLPIHPHLFSCCKANLKVEGRWWPKRHFLTLVRAVSEHLSPHVPSWSDACLSERSRSATCPTAPTDERAKGVGRRLLEMPLAVSPEETLVIRWGSNHASFLSDSCSFWFSVEWFTSITAGKVKFHSCFIDEGICLFF